MANISQTNNSINQILEMLKLYQTDTHPKEQNHFVQYPIKKGDYFSTQDLQQSTNQFSFSKDQLKQFKIGLHSSLDKIPKNREQTLSNRQRQSSFMNDSYNKSIFDRLYDENKSIKEKRDKLIMQGRKSVQEKQIKECTFFPNKQTKLKTQRSCRKDDVDAFYQKNMIWQTRKQKQIKQKQCQKNNQDKNQLTFVPKINSFYKKDRQNKENVYKKGGDSYLHNYHKINDKQLTQTGKKNAYKGIWNIKKGYFSYAR